jgi:hypothetical protein
MTACAARAARMLATMLALAAAAGCGPVTTPAPSASPPAPAPASAVVSAAASIPGILAVIPGEGRVTYSVTLRPGQCHARDAGRLPDPACTPGSLDPRVTQAGIAETICRHGWTATVRPPSGMTDRAKYDVAYPAYSVPAGTAAELDHLVPLELGGANDIGNLWPEAGAIPNRKDSVEGALRKAVCNGTVRLAAAQYAIAANWETAEKTVGIGG